MKRAVLNLQGAGRVYGIHRFLWITSELTSIGKSREDFMTAINFSQHGENRTAQRNIPNRLIEKALKEGEWRSAPGAAWLVRFRDVSVVVSQDGLIVTVYKTRIH